MTCTDGSDPDLCEHPGYNPLDGGHDRLRADVAAGWRWPRAPSISDRVRSTASGHSCTYVLGVMIGLLCPSADWTVLDRRPGVDQHGRVVVDVGRRARWPAACKVGPNDLGYDRVRPMLQIRRIMIPFGLRPYRHRSAPIRSLGGFDNGTHNVTMGCTPRQFPEPEPWTPPPAPPPWVPPEDGSDPNYWPHAKRPKKPITTARVLVAGFALLFAILALRIGLAFLAQLLAGS